MLKSILVSAVRNLLRNRSFSAITIAGLSISMSLSLLIILILKGQYSFDTFHEDADRIYRINTEAIRAEGGAERYASAPLAVGTALNDEYSYAESLVRLDRQFSSEVTYENTTVRLRGMFADQSFFNVFNFPLSKGSRESLLIDPSAVVLTTEAAEKIFGSVDPLGKMVTFSGYGEFVVTGVLAPFPGPTHFEFEALGSMRAIPILEKEGTVMQTLHNFGNYYTGYSYVKLKKGARPEDVEAALATIFIKNYADFNYETRDKGYRFYLQSLQAITPGPALSNNMGRGMPDVLLIVLGVLAFVIMVMAGLNYTQLMIAKSLTRSQEIGVRKIIGAHRRQVFFQFIGEAVVYSFIALGIAYLLLQAIKPLFSQLHIAQEFFIDMSEDGMVIALFVLFALIAGVFAGLLPAIYLSAFKPLKVLRGSTSGQRTQSRQVLRKSLLTTQFALSLVFLGLVVTVYRQVDYLLNADYGIRETDLVNVRLGNQDFERFANEVRRLNAVEGVGGVSHALGTWADRSSDYRRNPDDELFTMRDFIVDENYLKNLDVEIVAGKHFDPGISHQIILNETALDKFGFESALDAVGEKIFVGDSTEVSIVGVVQDFHFRPLSYQIGPVAFIYDPTGINILSIRTSPDHMTSVVSQVEAIWRKLDTRPFDWISMEAEIDNAYEQAGFNDILVILGYVTLIAVTLACLGILGMAIYTIQTRIKEVGVRKVMGASVTDILLLLTKSFLIMVVIAAAVALPLSYLLGEQMLSIYAYRIDASPWLLIACALFLATLALATIAVQTLRAARMNPVKSLRYE